MQRFLGRVLCASILLCVSFAAGADAVTDRFTLDPLETLRVDLWLSPQPIGLPALEEIPHVEG